MLFRNSAPDSWAMTVKVKFEILEAAPNQLWKFPGKLWASLGNCV